MCTCTCAARRIVVPSRTHTSLGTRIPTPHHLPPTTQPTTRLYPTTPLATETLFPHYYNPLSNGVPPMSLTTEPPMHPTEPRLASALITDADLDALYDRIANPNPSVQTRDSSAQRLATGVRSVDEALGGGLCAGTVVGVSSGDGAGVGVSPVDISALCAQTPLFS